MFRIVDTFYIDIILINKGAKFSNYYIITFQRLHRLHKILQKQFTKTLSVYLVYHKCVNHFQTKIHLWKGLYLICLPVESDGKIVKNTCLGLVLQQVR